MSDDLKENMMDTNIWLRLLFMLLFAVVFAATRVVLSAVIVVQFLWVLFTAKRNDKLLDFGSRLATFIYQIYRYLSFNTEKRPFPFDDFPTAAALLDDSIEEAADEIAEPEVEEPAAEVVEAEPVVEAETPVETAKEQADNAIDVTSETGVESDDTKKS